MERAWVGLGSNLDDPATQLARAFDALDALPGTRLLARSRIYRNPPMGPQDQPDYLNAVAALETALEPLALLEALQAIERAQGRVRTRHWGPRTLDLDLLLFADRVFDHPRLTLPHPGIRERAFVLVPLAEVAPADLEVPGQGRLGALLAACDTSALVPVEAGAA